MGHSGIFARNVGRVGEARTLQEGKVRGDAEQKLADLQLALSSLTSQGQLQAANAGSDILRSNLPAGEQAALQNRLSSLNLGAIPNIDLSQIANQAAGFSLSGAPSGAPISGGGAPFGPSSGYLFPDRPTNPNVAYV